MPLKMLIAIACLLALAGCNSLTTHGPQPPLSEHQRQQLGPVLLQPVYTAEQKTSGVTSGKGSGAAKGAGHASAEWLAASLGSGDVLVAMLGVMLTPVAMVAGGVYGGVVADSAEDVERHVAILQEVIAHSDAYYKNQLEQQLAATPYLPVVVGGSGLGLPHQSRLEINFKALQGNGGGPKSELQFSLLTETKLYQAGSTTPIYQRQYSVESGVQRLSAWVEQDGAPLRAAIDTLARETMQQILDDHFLSSPYTAQAEFPAKSYIFRPQRLKTQMPIFRWTLSEGRRMLRSEEQKGLVYQLRVLDDLGGVFEADGIEDTSYQFPDQLPVCGTYRWSVRANYEAYGQPRSTDWSAEKYFRTPCPKTI